MCAHSFTLVRLTIHALRRVTRQRGDPSKWTVQEILFLANGVTADPQECFKWDADSGACEPDTNKLMMSSIPQACPLVMVAELTKKCSNSVQQSSSGACQTASECMWFEAGVYEECDGISHRPLKF